MDLKTITATLALLGLSACGGEAKKDAPKTDDAKPADVKADAKPADAKPVEPKKDAVEVKAEGGKTGEMACAPGKCGAGSCGGKKDAPADGKAIPVDSAKPADGAAAAKPEDGKKT